MSAARQIPTGIYSTVIGDRESHGGRRAAGGRRHCARRAQADGSGLGGCQFESWGSGSLGTPSKGSGVWTNG
ncbi:hypothetical protein EYF80_048648 [Liparis tanakae]|uniref:Uncharacterized protein n=1 Tax=Liparis tanakae TaxID=230148 RepID=A0A4Z2FJ25_9TELE|nr:hypothetical protein EYF80_048648 [Liparis tanakae]